MTALAEARSSWRWPQALAEADATPRRAAEQPGPAHRVLDRRHGQARRARAQRVVRHRPDLRLRRRRPDQRRRRSSARTSTSRFVAKRLYALIGDTTDDGFVFRVDLALRPERQLGAAGGQPGDAGGVLPGPGPRVGALRLAEEPRRRAARQRAERPRAGAALAGHAVRLPPLPRLRRLRRPAPAAPQDPRRSAAPRRRPARARQRRQAVARRHPRDRIHRAAAAGRARRAVPRDPHPLHAEGPAAPERRAG